MTSRFEHAAPHLAEARRRRRAPQEGEQRLSALGFARALPRAVRLDLESWSRSKMRSLGHVLRVRQAVHLGLAPRTSATFRHAWLRSFRRGLHALALKHAPRTLGRLRGLPGVRGWLLERDRRLVEASGVFDAAWYLARCPEAAASGLGPLEHYLRLGWRQRHDPNALFDSDHYLALRPQLERAGVAPLVHYLWVGALEELGPCPLFSTPFYLDNHPDAALDERSPLAHYLREGHRRSPSPHPLFDVDFYLETHTDLGGRDALTHFLTVGAEQGANPNMYFDMEYYLAQNPDVRAAGLNPLVHYARWGAEQRREVSTLFDGVAYLEMNSDVAGWGAEPLGHFLRHGMHEGRLPYRTSPAPWVLKDRPRWRLRLHAGRPKVVLVLPDGRDTALGRTLLALARHLDRERGVECVIVLDEDGPLHPAFEAYGAVLVQRPPGLDVQLSAGALKQVDLADARFAVVASVRCAGYLDELRAAGIPAIGLVDDDLARAPQELARAMAALTGRLVYPNQGLLASGTALEPDATGRARVLSVCGQLAEPAGPSRSEARRSLLNGSASTAAQVEPFVVLGCGASDAAQELAAFREVALLARERAVGAPRPLRFVWIRIDDDARSPSSAPESREDGPVQVLGPVRDLAPLLRAADAYLSTASSEPFHSPLLEALGSGLPVVAFASEGGFCDEVASGAGRVVPRGASGEALDALLAIGADPQAACSMAARGRSLRRERFGLPRYLDALCDLAERELSISLPAPPTPMQSPPSRKGPRVIFTTPVWNISGVNTFTETLMKGLLERGFDAELILTSSEDPLPAVPDVPHRTLDQAVPGEDGPWSAGRWKRVMQMLVESAPCIFVPGFDYFASAICPGLPDDVGVLGVVHSDDYEHYEHAARLGRYWNALVGVSATCYERLLALNRGLKPNTFYIPYGIELPATPGRVRPRGARPLRIVWTGRIEQPQKNVLALPGLVRELDALELDYQLTLVGDGSQTETLRRELATQVEAGRVCLPGRMTQAQVRAELSDSDVFLLVSHFEGLPVSMLEAMACGCVPVVSQMDSGVPELVEQGVTGFSLPPHDLAAFAAKMKLLADEPERLERMARAASDLIVRRYGAARMTEDYAEVLEEIWREITLDLYRRPAPIMPASEAGAILLPTWLERDPATFR